MHFLCLHGIGTNSHVLETQTASLRHEMDQYHTFDFVEGTISCPAAPEIQAFFSPKDEYFQYYDSSARSILLALDQLSTYIEEEGPFDGVIAFSQGAALVSAYLIHVSRQNKSMPFRCAIFLSGALPFDPEALREGTVEHVQVPRTGPLLTLPTTHIWGRKDMEFKRDSEMLASFCDESQREQFVHEKGHEIPGSRAHEDLQRCARVIRRTIEKASIEC